MNTSIPPFHNPNNLTPEQYGASEGWRLLRVSERVPDDAQYFSVVQSLWLGSDWEGAKINGSCSAYRTRTRDPFAPADDWVKMSERKPVASNLPLILGAYPEGVNCAWTQLYCTTVMPCLDGWTHWTAQPKIPLPPARELTQAELDERAFSDFYAKSETKIRDMGKVQGDAFYAGVAYERARTAK